MTQIRFRDTLENYSKEEENIYKKRLIRSMTQ